MRQSNQAFEFVIARSSCDEAIQSVLAAPGLLAVGDASRCPRLAMTKWPWFVGCFSVSLSGKKMERRTLKAGYSAATTGTR
jgi:hypothetical protein